MQTDITYSVKVMVDSMKPLIEKNLNTAVRNNMLTIDEDKIPGIVKLVQDTIDQGFIEGSDQLINTLNHYAKN
tara:strand:- start:122 stop:340 length:219 start_codon:yes stop_codon:yes gene_type:complete